MKSVVRAAASSIASGRLSSRSHRLRTRGDASRLAAERPGTGGEQRHAVVRDERRHRPHLLALELQPLPARHEQGHGGRLQQSRDVGRGLRQQVLGVVEEHELPLAREGVDDGVRQGAVGFLLEPQRLRHGGDDEGRVAERRERHPDEPVRETLGGLRAGLQRKTCLSRPARARQCEQPNVLALEQLDDVAQLQLATEERRRRHGQIRSRPRDMGCRRGRDGAELERGVVAQDRLLELLQRLAGVEAELVEQSRARLLVGGERVCLPARAVEREDQQPGEALAQRVIADEPFELADDLARGGRARGRPRAAVRARPGAAPRAGRSRCARTPRSRTPQAASPRQSPSASRSSSAASLGIALGEQPRP